MKSLTSLLALLILAGCAPCQGGSPPQVMKIIGAGLGRTGTLSLYTALRQLGYKTHHMKEVIDDQWVQSEPFARWSMSVGTPSEAAGIDNVLALLANQGYNATTDFPSCLLVFAMIQRYPDSKVILSVRDTPRAWTNSVRRTILPMRKIATTGLTQFITPSVTDKIFDVASTWTGISPTEESSDEELDAFYTRWNDVVKAAVPPDRLLVHNAKDGWGPICDFLDLDDNDECPETPYPNVNDTKEFEKLVWTFKFVSQYGYTILATLFVVVQYSMWYCFGGGWRRGMGKEVRAKNI